MVERLKRYVRLQNHSQIVESGGIAQCRGCLRRQILDRAALIGNPRIASSRLKRRKWRRAALGGAPLLCLDHRGDARDDVSGTGRSVGRSKGVYMSVKCHPQRDRCLNDWSRQSLRWNMNKEP
jgi:hypothetical protein